MDNLDRNLLFQSANRTKFSNNLVFSGLLANSI